MCVCVLDEEELELIPISQHDRDYYKKHKQSFLKGFHTWYSYSAGGPIHNIVTPAVQYCSI